MKLYHVHQNLVSNRLENIPEEVFRQLDSLSIDVPKGDVAITAGSRGIADIAQITRAVGDWLKKEGATPFIIPSMGSHNGATAEGQRAMVESLGITESAMDMEIRASMECVKLGEVETGDVFMDRHAYESEGAIVLNRIKLHTCFAGIVQSGLMKMMVVGMGKIRSAETFHSAPTPEMNRMIIQMGQMLIDSGKILAGVGILEDGFDATAEIHAVAPDQITTVEPQLLEKHKNYFPRLPVDALNVLIVDQTGKIFSGTGMDPNVIGRSGVRDLHIDGPDIHIIAALRLHPKSQGNALGVGLADFITQEFRDSIDEHKTLINTLTTGEMARLKIPATLNNDETLIDTIGSRFGHHRWMFAPNTLHLEDLYVSEDLCEELAGHPKCEVADDPTTLSFSNGRHELVF
jgi:hypothetical protein